MVVIWGSSFGTWPMEVNGLDKYPLYLFLHRTIGFIISGLIPKIPSGGTSLHLRCLFFGDIFWAICT